MRHAARVPQCVLEGDVAAERVAEHGPPLEAQRRRSASASAVRFSQVIDETGGVERPLHRWS